MFISNIPYARHCNPLLIKEGCNWGHGLSAAIKLGTPEPGFFHFGAIFQISLIYALLGVRSPCVVHLDVWMNSKIRDLMKDLNF